MSHRRAPRPAVSAFRAARDRAARYRWERTVRQFRAVAAEAVSRGDRTP